MSSFYEVSHAGDGDGQPPDGGGTPRQEARTHPRATATLVLGVLGLPLCGVLSIVAAVMGTKAIREIDADPGAYRGRRRVVTGRVLGVVGAAVWGFAAISSAVALVVLLILGGPAAILGLDRSARSGAGAPAQVPNSTEAPTPSSSSPSGPTGPTGQTASPTPTGPTVVIGVKFDQPGLGWQENGDVSGFDVDVARYLATALGYGPVQFVEAPAAQRETLLQSGQVEMVVATYAITDDRREKVSFAGPYLTAGLDLLVRTSESAVTGPDELGGRRLCTVPGSTSAQTVRDMYASTVVLVERDSYAECVAALAAGDLDAVVAPNFWLAGFAAQPQYRGKLTVVGNPFSEERYGVGLPKGDTARCEQINAALQQMVSDGSWQRAVEANFGPAGFTPPVGAQPSTADPCE